MKKKKKTFKTIVKFSERIFQISASNKIIIDVKFLIEYTIFYSIYGGLRVDFQAGLQTVQYEVYGRVKFS